MAEQPTPGAPGGLHSLFERQARETPDAVALTAAGRTITYAALDARAAHVAGALRARGAAPERLVGIAAELTVDTVVAALAVLKAGAAYAGLDPRAPYERLRALAAGLDLRLAFASGGAAADALRSAGVEVLDLNDLPTAAQRLRPHHRIPPGRLAYVIHTSGSTGRPKPVGIEHGSAVAFLHWARTAFPPDALAGSLATTGPALDCHLLELWAPLAWGGRAVLAASTLDLPSAPHAAAATLVSSVPRVVGELVRARALPPSVHTVNLAGDTVPAALVDELARVPTVQRVFNHYGPSETTTYSTGAVLTARSDGRPPIGRAITGTRIHLDGEEICIAGAGVARGYLGAPGLTAERFVAEPGTHGRRMYRTGDRGRRRTDGQLEFLGRLDRQLKVHGFRVEPGEVEAALRTHPAVREAAVALHEPPGRPPRLAAWVLADGASPDDLRRHAAEALPPHMVPAVVVPVDVLPRTASGKVDYRSLPAPRPSSRAELRDLLVPPSAR